MAWPRWFNGNPFRPRTLPGPEQAQPIEALRLPQGAAGSGMGPHPLTMLLPHIPHEPGPLLHFGNQQVGTQAARAQAVLAGHSVTDAYALHPGEAHPVLSHAIPQLGAPMPPSGVHELGPLGRVVSTGVR